MCFFAPFGARGLLPHLVHWGSLSKPLAQALAKRVTHISEFVSQSTVKTGVASSQPHEVQGDLSFTPAICEPRE